MVVGLIFRRLPWQVMTFRMARAMALVTDVHSLLEQGDILFDSEK
jgi:hypothetical protein